LKSDFIKHSLPHHVFAKHNLHSSFLVNYWEYIMTLAIFFALAAIFMALERLTGFLKQDSMKAFFRGMRILCKWNVILMYFATSLDDIILYLALEFRSFKAETDSTLPEVSFIVGFVFLTCVLVLFGGTYWLIKKQNKMKSSIAPERFQMATRNKWQGFQVLFRGFRDTSIWNQMFFLIYMARIGFPMFIVAVATESPLTISIFQVLISIGMLSYLMKMEPFKKRINHYQILIFESIVLIMNICMLVLTIFSVKGYQHEYVSMLLGDIVIVGNDIINILCLAFLVIKLKIEADNITRRLMKKSVDKPREVGLWVQLLSLPFQQGNMGFEEMIEDDPTGWPVRRVKPFSGASVEKEVITMMTVEETGKVRREEVDLRTRVKQRLERIREGKASSPVAQGESEKLKTLNFTGDDVSQLESGRKTPDSSLINLNQDATSEMRQLRRRGRSQILSKLFEKKRALRIQEEGEEDIEEAGSPIIGQKSSQVELMGLTNGTTYPFSLGENRTRLRKQSSDVLMGSLNTGSPASINGTGNSRLLLTKVGSIEENNSSYFANYHKK